MYLHGAGCTEVYNDQFLLKLLWRGVIELYCIILRVIANIFSLISMN